MDSHSVELLEFSFVLNKLKALCIGPEGEHELDEQDFFTDRNSLDGMLERVTYLKRLIESEISQPELRLPEISRALAAVCVEGSLLEGRQLIAIAQFIRGSVELNRFVCSSIGENEASPFIDDSAHLPDVRDLSRYIFSNLEIDGTVKESLPELRAIRKKMQRA